MAMAARILTRMATRLMTTDVLILSQLLSPAFPVGAFAYSHGLERAVTDNTIHDAATLEAWLLDLIDMGGARSDAVLVSVAYQTEATQLFRRSLRRFGRAVAGNRFAGCGVL